MQPSEFDNLTLAKFFALIGGEKKEKPLSYNQVVKMMRQVQKEKYGRKLPGEK